MLSEEDKSLVRVLLEQEVLPKEKLDIAIRERERLEASGEKLSLGQILLRLQFIDVKTFCKIRGTRPRESKDERFGNMETSNAEVQTPKRHIIGNYLILEKIAEGGMGVVYKARQIKINREVALKLLTDRDEKNVKRFVQEIEAVGRLDHPNIVRIYDAGEHEGAYYFAMEYIEGGTLRDWIKNKRISESKILKLMEQIIRTIHFAHEQGIIHRDLKPANILMTKDGIPKISDFGLAKVADRKSSLTESGAQVGTPYYMSPEQAAASRQIDVRTDIYSLGVILYEMLTHRLPFVGKTTIKILVKVMEQDPPSPRKYNKKIHKAVETIILKAMEKAPKNRYQSAQIFADDIARYLNKEDIQARRPSFLKAGFRYLKRRAIPATVGALMFVIVALIFLLVGERGQTMLPDKTRHAPNITTNLKKAEELLEETKFTDSLDALQKVLAVEPDHPKALYLKAVVDYFTGNPAPVILALDKVILKEKKPEAYLYRAAAKLKLSKFEDGEKDLTQAIALDPFFAYAYYYRGCAYYKQQMREKALKDFKKALELYPGYFIAYCSMAFVLYEKKKYQEAMATLDKALELRPKEYLPFYMKAMFQFTAGNLEASAGTFESMFEETDEADPPSYQKEFRDKGEFLCSLTELQQTFNADIMENFAPTIVTQITAKGPGAITQIYPNLARILYVLEEYDQALMIVNQGLAMVPGSPELIKWRGIATLAKGKAQKALDDIDLVLKRYPRDWESLYFRGKAYLELGKNDKALQDWNRSLEINPKQKRLRAKFEKLREGNDK